MATDSLVVLLEGRRIGTILREATSRLRLTYDDAYTSDPHATPLSLSMPPVVRVHTDRAMTPWLWGLLPDNEQVLRRWGRDLSASANSPFSLLATQVGHDCAGAVQFARPGEVDALAGRPGSIEPLAESDVATILRELREDSTAWLGPGFTGQFSLAGAQAKTALHFADGTWGRPTGTMATSHILKPAIAGFESQDLNEHLCLTAARRLGLAGAETQISTFEDQTAIAVRRYDRSFNEDGTLVRIHQEDLCQAAGVHRSYKYQADGGPSPATIAELLRTKLPARAATEAVERFADALIFNWLIAGTDAHAKNYSLLLSGHEIRLAPLYDMASFLPYDTSKGHKVKLAMKIGDEYRLLSTDRPGPWERTARDLGLRYEALRLRLLDLADRVADAFAAAASDPSVTALESDLPSCLTDLVAARAAHCLEALG